ncbi:MAG: RNA 2',3'-cyclic phosphodiesterase, partial [Rubrobacteridae bacterium]|nr:RNA 2',3'-cyclic phosphodiesterase [Rubrobacteridae bacterium]
LGIELSPQTRTLLECLMQELSADISNTKWISKDNLHLTLKFLGDTPNTKQPLIEETTREAISGFRKFSATLDKPGSFPNENKARVIWVGIRFGAAELISLAGKIDQYLIEHGFQTENKPFKPHITLARIKTPIPVGAALHKIDTADISGHVINVSAVTIFESTLSKQGAKYEIVSRIPLKP